MSPPVEPEEAAQDSVEVPDASPASGLLPTAAASVAEGTAGARLERGSAALFRVPPVVGKIHPGTGTKVKTLILSAEHCWVFLDENLVVEWACKKTFEGYELVLNSMAILEAVPIGALAEEHRFAFRSLLAEGLARHLLSGHTDAALAMHKTADDYVRARLRELARAWYLWTALIALGLAALFVALLSVVPAFELWRYSEVHRTALLCLGFGAIGASSSLISRIGHFSLDPSAGKSLHRLEAIARVSVGAISAIVAYLAILADFMLPSFSEHPAGIFLLAFVAGASERFIPTLIEKVEIGASEK